MKKINLPNLKSVVYGFMIVLIVASCKKDQKPENEESASNSENAVVESCDCDASWFPHSQTPDPAEGKGSPFDVSSTTNCIFHQWSWQKFLWLTKPEENNNPLFLNKLIQVSDALAPVTKQTGATIVLTYTQQAGSNGVLKANPAYGGSDQIAKDFTVYYSIHANDVLLLAAKRFKDSLIAKTLPETNLSTFPVGSLELKVSWIDANTIKKEDQGKFFTTFAAFTNDGGKTYTNKKVALLGMHVVGVVINHPEFIWATFQHKDLAPFYDWKKNHTDSAEEKLLYAKGETKGLDGITWVKNSGVKLPLKPFDLFQYGVPRNPGGGYMQTSQSEPLNFDNIDNINKCVAAKLNDVWNNYFYNGSIWLNTDGMNKQQQAQLIVDLGYGIDKAIPGSNARGSLNNANITMETFTQTFENDISKINNTNVANCFSCHSGVSFDSSAPKSPIYLSHAFGGYIERHEGKTDAQIEQMKNKEHELRFVKKTLK